MPIDWSEQIKSKKVTIDVEYEPPPKTPKVGDVWAYREEATGFTGEYVVIGIEYDENTMEFTCELEIKEAKHDD